jgi:hypothetical protein
MHTYEVFVDIKECDNQTYATSRILATRYEIDADTQTLAHDGALHQAEQDYPQATEFDVRVTRFLK